METRRRRSRRPGWPFVAVAAAVLAAALYFIPLPYYIESPGMALPLQSVVDVQGGHRNARGEFMLTTVYEVYAANVYDFLYGLLLPNRQILPTSQVDPGMSAQEYNQLNAYFMDHAHQDAVIAALRYLRIPVRVTTRGVRVVWVEPTSPASLVLREGDIITAVDGVSLANPDRLYGLLRNRKAGQSVTLRILRGDRTLIVKTRLVRLPSIAGVAGPRAGIGILPGVAETVRSPVRVTIHSGDINGPSAGLMFALEIVNQLYKGGDLTRGYKIAGTGTINSAGVVGQIGGAAHKVVAANNAGARYFLVPADTAPGDTNQLHAEQEAAKLHTRMRIVPVRTLSQAVQFLLSLPARGG